MIHSACLLQWVLVDDELRNVSDFAHIESSQRPIALCPICRQRVVMKLGTQRVHHCAHQPNSECVTTNPETALHFNIKFYLANELKDARSLIIEAPCPSRHACNSTYTTEWLTDWDEIEVEYSIDTRRPDIALLKNGKVIGALEVHVTHAVDEEKAAFFQANNIPWVEIEGSEEIYLGENRWVAAQPLQVSKHQPPGEICEYCSSIEKMKRAREYKAKNYTGISSVKIVDFYFPSGKKFREVYELNECVEDGQRIEVWLSRRSDRTTIAGARSPITQGVMASINQAFENHLLDIQRRTNAVVDSAMKWTAWSSMFEDSHKVYSDAYFPRRYVWWPAENKWFLPKANREITWDIDK